MVGLISGGSCAPRLNLGEVVCLAAGDAGRALTERAESRNEKSSNPTLVLTQGLLDGITVAVT